MRYNLVPAALMVGLAAGGGVLVGTDRVPALAVLAPLALAIPVLSIRYLGLGVALLPVVGAAVPFAVGTGTESRVVAALIFSVFLIACWVARGLLVRDVRLVASPVVLPTLALILVWIVAYLCSIVVRDPRVSVWSTFDLAQLGGLSVAVVPAAILLMALNMGCDVRWIRLAVWSFVAVGAVAGVAYYIGAQPLASQVLETGGLFTMWLVALSLGQALFNERLPGWARVGLIGLCVAWLYKAAVLQSWWFSGWLPSIVAVTVIVFLWSKKAFVGLAIAGAILAVVRFEELFDAVWGQAVRKGDLSRLDIWGQTFDLVGQYPVLGTGPAGYAVYFMSLYAGSKFSMSTHNNYVDVLAQTGIVGMITFAAFLLALLFVGWRAISYWRAGFMGGYAQGAFGGLIGLIVAMAQGDWFIPFVYNQTIAGYRYTVLSWVFLGFLASLAVLRQAASTRRREQWLPPDDRSG